MLRSRESKAVQVRDDRTDQTGIKPNRIDFRIFQTADLL